MQAVFSIIAVIDVLYIIFKKRKFDYFSIAVLSAIIYMYPGFYNRLYYYYTSISTSYEKITTKTYVCLSLFLLLLLIFTIISDNVKFVWNREKHLLTDNYCTDFIYSNTIDNKAILSVAVFGLCLGIYTIMKFGGFVGDVDSKLVILQGANRLTEYFKYISLFIFSYAFMNRGKYIYVIRILSTIAILFTFLLGHRSFLVLGIIVIFTHYVSASSEKNFFGFICKHKIAFFLIVIAAFFFLFVKGVFFYFMSGDYSTVMNKLLDPSYYLKSIFHSEAGGIVLNLQNSICLNLNYDLGDILIQFVFMIPVFGKQILISTGYKGFDYLLNEQINVKFDEGIGLGATYLGEAYSVDGFFSFVVLISFTLIFLFALNKNLKSIKNGISYTFCSIVLVYFTFYLHRNSIGILLTFIRAQLYIWILAMLIRVCYTGTMRVSAMRVSMGDYNK